MAQIISASIDLSKIDKSKIITGKQGGKYYNFTVIVNDSNDQYGNDCALTAGQTKEERASNAKKVYIGNGRTIWKGQSQKPAPSKEPIVRDDYTVSSDDLPF